MTPRSWLDAWVDLTTWWVEPAVAAAQRFPAQAEELLAQMIDGVVARFGGERVDLTIRGQQVVATLDSMRLLRRRDRRELRIDLSDVDAAGVLFDTLGIVASVRLEPGVQPTFVATGIAVEGCAPLEPVIAWIDDRIGEWLLEVSDHQIIARRGGSEATFVVEPFVRDDTVRLELRGVRWRKFAIGLPRWLRIERAFPVAMAPGWSLREARRDGDRVRFRLRGREVEQRLDAPRLREAIVRGAQLSF